MRISELIDIPIKSVRSLISFIAVVDYVAALLVHQLYYLRAPGLKSSIVLSFALGIVLFRYAFAQFAKHKHTAILPQEKYSIVVSSCSLIVAIPACFWHMSPYLLFVFAASSIGFVWFEVFRGWR